MRAKAKHYLSMMEKCRFININQRLVDEEVSIAHDVITFTGSNETF